MAWRWRNYPGGIEYSGHREMAPDRAEPLSLTSTLTAIVAERDALRDDRDQWKANHDQMVQRNAVLRERPDLPVDRLPAIARYEASLATATARAERAEAEKRAVITLLYTDGVFVGSHWESYPDADKGIWPALCAHVDTYGADGEEIPADQLIPLANLVDQFGSDAVQAWVCHRRGLEKPQKGNLTANAAKALAHLATLTKENDNGR